MTQPVRKIIKENHPDINISPIYTLLIDGNALLRRAFKDNKINSLGEHYGGIFQFLLQIRMQLQKKVFDYIYVVFDSHDSGLFRYQLYKDYKANRDKDYAASSTEKSDYWKEYEQSLKSMQNAIFNKKKEKQEKRGEEEVVDANFNRERDILLKYFNELYIRWFYDPEDPTEGDDMIAYYVKNKRPEEKIVIMTGDRDLGQLISDSVCIYDLNTKKYLSDKNFAEIIGIPPQNVVTKKILLGDSSDNIKGVTGLSEKRLVELIPEIKSITVGISDVIERAKQKIDERVAEKKKPLKWHENIVNGVHNGNYDSDFYKINEQIISLDKPLMSEEMKKDMDATMYNVQDPEGRSFGNLYAYMEDDGIDDLRDSSRFASFFEPFKPFINKEIKRYNDSLKS